MLFAMSGLLGLAPVWYHFQNAIPVRPSFAQGVEGLALGVSLTPHHGARSSSLKKESRTENPSLLAQSHKDGDNLAENALRPQSHTAIESLQINATLSRSTLDPELAERLGLETPDDTAAR